VGSEKDDEGSFFRIEVDPSDRNCGTVQFEVSLGKGSVVVVVLQ